MLVQALIISKSHYRQQLIYSLFQIVRHLGLCQFIHSNHCCIFPMYEHGFAMHLRKGMKIIL